MDWYYVRDRQRFGPISDDEFQRMVGQGAITPDTLVWHRGMQDWQRYGNVVAAGQAGAPATAAPQQTEATFPCYECGRYFPQSEMIRHGQFNVCGNCKNIFFQRIREGMTLPGALQFAGFWIRVAAYLIDMVILMVANIIVQMPLQFMMIPSNMNMEPGEMPGAGFWMIWAVMMLLQIAVPMAYETWFVGKYMATPGKMALGLKVIRPDGSGLTYLRAFARYWAKVLSGIILGIGYLMAAFDDEKKGLHDIICDTRVVRK